jgi:1,4-dihydroxy-2-naphthoate polyprenyltransferase
MSNSQPQLTIQKNSLKAWFLATRPKTLAPSFAPILTATLLAYFNHTLIRWELSLSALLASLCIQIGTNLINDSQDSSNKKDTGMRLGPLRMSQAGFLSRQHVYAAGLFSFCLALMFGIPLMIQGGYPLLLALVASSLAGYFYTGGPYPLAYHGLGEVFTMVFFGWVITDAIYYIQTGTITIAALVLGTQMGLFTTSLLAMTSFRDIVEDTQTQKKTLTVRFGPTFARIEITLTALLPFIINLYWLSDGYLWICFLPFIALPLAVRYAYNVWKHDPSRLYIKFIGMACLLQLAFGILLGIAFIIQP